MGYSEHGSQGQTYPFPSELVSSKEKGGHNYGLTLAKAIYYNNKTSNSAIFYNDRAVYRTYIKYALGDQSIDQYKPLLGINPDNINESMLPSIRWSIRNYAKKRIDVVVALISERGYDPVVNALDENANNYKKDYKGRIKAYVRDKAWIDSIGAELGHDFLPEGFDINNIPTNDEEIDIHVQTNSKLRSEIELELGIAYHLAKNGYEITRPKIIFDIAVLGVACLWVGMDERKMPVIKRIKPEDMIAPYSEQPDFSNINYAGSIRRMTVGELKKLAGNQFTKEQYDTIAREFTNTTDREHYDGDYRNEEYATDYRDVRKVKVLHFEWRTIDEFVHVSKKDNYGNERFSKKPYDYYNESGGMDKFKKKHPDRKITRTPYTTVYAGYWVVGSDELLFTYGLKKHQERRRGNLGETPLGYKLYAPDMYDGVVVGMIKQMIPVLDNLQSYHLKLQHVVASAVPKGLEIDLHQLAKAKFKGANGKELTDLQKLNMYRQTGVMIRDSAGRYAQGTNDRPIRELENGMANDIVRYIELIQQSLQELDEITGVNRVISGSNLHEKTGKSVAEMQVASAQTALEYMYNGDKYIFSEVVKSLGIFHVQSVKYSKKGRYKDIIGESSVRFLINDSGILDHDFGYEVEVRPSPEEWQRLYLDVAKAVELGQIGIDDKVAVERIKNLKQAQLYLKYAVDKNRKRAQQDKQQDSELNGQIQQQSNAQAHDNAINEEKAKANSIVIKGKEDRKTLLLKEKLQTERELKLLGVKGEYKLAETEGINESKEEIAILNKIDNEKEE